jgi:quinol monooxygenase YgiN
LFCYHIKIGVKKYKTDELLDSLRMFSDQFRKDSGCLGYNIYRDCDTSLSYTVVGEWQTYLAMKQHFQTDNFKVLIGAVKVLGESSELLSAETVSLTKNELR